MTHIIEFPFHIGDFKSAVSLMDATEIGAYTMLLITHYSEGVFGLPDDDDRLARAAHVSPKVWVRLRPILSNKFTIADGRWTHEKVIETLQKIEEKSLAAQENAEKRWQKNGENTIDFFSQKSPNIEAKSLKSINPTYADAYANQKPITKGYKTPLPPLPVDNSDAPTPEELSVIAAETGIGGEIRGSAGDGHEAKPVQGFDVQRHLTDRGLAVARQNAPGWDIYHLIKLYNAFTRERGPPRNPEPAFAGWCKKFTKGRPPQ